MLNLIFDIGTLVREKTIFRVVEIEYTRFEELIEGYPF